MKSKKMRLFIFAISFLIISLSSFGQTSLQPKPKMLERMDEAVLLSSNHNVFVQYENEVEQKAANYFEHILPDEYTKVNRNADENIWQVSFETVPYSEEMNNKQFYSIYFDKDLNQIELSSPSQLGLLYAAVTLSDLMKEDDGQLIVEAINITDYPDNTRREFVANPSAADIASLFDFALQNKIETVVLASRQHPWYEITEDYLSILQEVKKWKDKYGGPKVMQSHNIYEGPDIVISSENDVDKLKEVIEVSYQHGIEKLMILSDDTPPFKFGEGYILTNENDKKKFPHFEAANTYLLNELVEWFDKNNYEIETYYVPAFYTYEDMHHGDVELFKDTPWEDGAFKPFFRDLKYLGENLYEEVFIIWTGPYVRSRKISEEDIKDWTNNLKGRVPFLWDNTIYSHHPFTSTPLLTAWDNKFPENFAEVTGGNGMFVNGDINSESTVAAAITTNDYLWNPKNYNPQKSLETAVAREYGEKLVDLVLQFKDAELELRKTIGERKLWFEADTLWQQIREVRFITDKNPFYYHLNYTRMKALRLQLKASVPEPEAKHLFISKCNDIEKRRNEILSAIENVDAEVYNRLKTLAEPLPDFNSIQ